jgi:hypothetical protein
MRFGKGKGGHLDVDEMINRRLRRRGWKQVLEAIYSGTFWTPSFEALQIYFPKLNLFTDT